MRVWRGGEHIPPGVMLSLLVVTFLWSAAASGAPTKEDVVSVPINLKEDSSSPWFQRVLQIPASVASVTICLHIRILFLRTNPSIMFYLQDAPYYLIVEAGRLKAKVRSLLLTHRQLMTTHAWQHVCLVTGERPALALNGKYTEEVDVRSSGDAGQLLQGNATLRLGRKRNCSEGLWDSVGGFATLPQVFLSRLEEDQVGALAQCKEGPTDDLGTLAWQVVGQAGEVLGQVNPNKNMQRVADLFTFSIVQLESANGVCPPHALEQLLLLPGAHTPSQAARRCRTLGGQLPDPEDMRVTSLGSAVEREWHGRELSCWAAPAGKYLLIMAGGKVQHQFPEDGFHSNASTGLCCQIPLGPVVELRVQELNYDGGHFAIVPWGTKLRFVSTKGAMIYSQDEELEAHVYDSWAWSMAFSGHWTGRHEVVSFSSQWHGLGRHVVMSVCSEDEFTCSDGYCVPLDARCDGHDDCGDKADEERCDVISEYRQSRVRHSFSPINFTFDLVMIEEVNEDNLFIKVWLQLRSTWHDDSLTLWHLNQHPEGHVIPKDNVPWTPSYRLENVLFDDFLHRQSPEHKVVTVTARKLSDGSPGVYDLLEGYEFSAGKEAVLTVTEDLQARFTCYLDYEVYPIDSQICEFNISLVTGGNSKPYFNKEGLRTISKTLRTNVFTVDSIRQQCPHSLPDRPSSISYRILLNRVFARFIWTSIFPSLIISVIGNMTYVFDLDNFSDRIMVTLSCLIVLASLFSQGVTNGPTNTTIKLIDMFFFVIINRLYFVFLGHVIYRCVLRWIKDVGRDMEEAMVPGCNESRDKDSTTGTSTENLKTHREGENHHGNKRKPKKLKALRDGWVDEVTKSSSTGTINKKTPSSSLSTHWKIKLYKFLTNHSHKIKAAIYYAFGIVDIAVLAFFIVKVNRYNTRIQAKFDEYCDTNLE